MRYIQLIAVKQFGEQFAKSLDIEFRSIFIVGVDNVASQQVCDLDIVVAAWICVIERSPNDYD